MISIWFFGAMALAGPPAGPSRYVPSQPSAKVDGVLSAAVEKSVAGVPWAFRGIARPKLKPLATACPGYNFVIEGDWFSVQCDGKSLVRKQVGTTTPWTDKSGTTMQATLSRQASAYTLDFKGEQGGKKFRYAFGEDGSLVVTQTVYSPSLTVPMVWSLAYRAN